MQRALYAYRSKSNTESYAFLSNYNNFIYTKYVLFQKTECNKQYIPSCIQTFHLIFKNT